MKKIIFALAFAACMLLSCTGEMTNAKTSAQQPTENQPPKTVEYLRVDRRIQKPVSNSVTRVYHFEYDGHKYLQFHCIGSHGGHESIVHDPDCDNPIHRVE